MTMRIAVTCEVCGFCVQVDSIHHESARAQLSRTWAFLPGGHHECPNCKDLDSSTRAYLRSGLR